MPATVQIDPIATMPSAETLLLLSNGWPDTTNAHKLLRKFAAVGAERFTPQQMAVQVTFYLRIFYIKEVNGQETAFWYCVKENMGWIKHIVDQILSEVIDADADFAREVKFLLQQEMIKHVYLS